MSTSSAFNFPTPTVSWSDVARVCRRICTLRERGELEAAEHLRASQLQQLVSAARSPDDNDATLEEKLAAVFALEAERVANAAVLAELVVPQLTEQLRHLLPPTTTPVPAIEAATLGAAPARARPAPRDIGDFIDEMIAQDQAELRRTPATTRRAS